MRESYSGYLVPPSEMEDVSMDNGRSEHFATTKSQYESIGKPRRCLHVTNNWDVVRSYKPLISTAVVIILALSSLLAVMIYVSIQSAENYSSRPVLIVEEAPATEVEVFSKEEIGDDTKDNEVSQYDYDVVRETVPKLKKREIRRIRNSGDRRFRANDVKFRDVEDSIRMMKSANRGTRDVPKISEIHNTADEQQNRRKREINRRQKYNACQRDTQHCKTVVASMHSMVENAGRNIDNLRQLVKHIQFNAASRQTDSPYDDILRCLECEKINNEIKFIDTDSKNSPGYYQQHYFPNVYPPMINMSSVSALLDNGKTNGKEVSQAETNEDDQKNSVVPTITQNSGTNIEKTVEVSRLKKLTDEGEITHIIKNTTIIKKPEKKPEKDNRESFVPLPGAAPTESSTERGMSFDSLRPLRPRPPMHFYGGYGRPSSPIVFPSASDYRSSADGSENSGTGEPEEEYEPAPSADAPFEGRSHREPSASDESMSPFQPRILTGGKFQPSKTKTYGNTMPMPTAETTKADQQVLYTPGMPYQVCYYGSPPGYGPPVAPLAGPFRPIPSGAMNFPVSSSGPPHYPYAGNPYAQRGYNGFPSQNYPPAQFQPQPGTQFGAIPQFQQINGATGFQQADQRVEPTGPGVQNFGASIENPSMAPRPIGLVPYYCVYVTTPVFQTPVMPGITDFQRSADGFSDRARSAGNRYDGPEPAWSGNTSNYQGFPGDCDHNSYHCYDGSRCIPKDLWCDGSVDCPDVSDEIRCSCRDRISKDRICDGYSDCPHDEDELGCFDCSKDHFSCGVSSTRFRHKKCLPLTERCDGHKQCSNGKDEEDCSILTESYIKDPNAVTVGYTSGYLHKNWRGQWYPVCTNTTQWAVDACVAENHFPLSESPSIRMEFIPSGLYNGSYIIQSQNGEIRVVPTCHDRVIRVDCPELPCGTRVPSNDIYRPFGDREDSLVALPRSRNGDQENDVANDNIAGDDEEAIVGDSRVVGGRDSSPKAWPFLVGIWRNGYFHCGGTIVDSEWVLTAAHCVDGFRRYYYEIQAGLLRRFSFSPMAERRHAFNIIVHPKYNPKTMKNDLALIRLHEPLRFNRWIRPTCLPKNASVSSYWSQGPAAHTTCMTVGWGATNENGPDPDHLREVEVPILPECKHPEDRNEAEICAGYPQGGRDACQGDSGGPLMCRYPGSMNQWYVAGIVSHGNGCARANEPGAYTKVSQFVDWIDDTRRTEKFRALESRALSTCPGFSCNGGLGKCLPRHKRCDKIINCLDSEDELDCPVQRSASTFRDASKFDIDQESDDPDAEVVAQSTPDFGQANDKPTNESEDGATDLPEPRYPAENFDSTPTSTSVTQEDITDDVSGKDSTSTEPITTTDEPDSARQRKKENFNVPNFSCTRLLQTIPMSKRCNRVLDCQDGTDEDNCNCKDYLANVHPISICDGIVDCHDGSDEENCKFCQENDFFCGRSGKCIPQTKVCDHEIDCPYMEDELDCFALTNGREIYMDFDERPHLNPVGLLTYRGNIGWQTACQKLNETVQLRVANEYCEYLGFGAAEQYFEKLIANESMIVLQSTKTDLIPYEYPSIGVVANNRSAECTVLYIKCKTVVSASSKHLIARNLRNNQVSYLLPWQAHIFVDGRYHCPAILLDHVWILASSICTENLDLNVNHTTVLFGTGPAYLYVDGPFQQSSSIESMEILKKLDAVLFHIDRPVNITRYVQPIFIEKQIFPATNTEVCLTTGVDDRHRTKITFLRPEPEKCSQCHRCYTSARNEDCRNDNGTSEKWSGIVVCRELNFWYPTAIFVDKDLTCGFQSPQQMTSIDYGFTYVTEAMKKTVDPITGPICDGLRCPLGNCLPWNKVCDGVDDCRDGTDEKHCAQKRQSCEDRNAIGCQCTKSELRCSNGQCVPREAFCNSIADCEDGSDEPVTCSCAAYLGLTAPELLCDNVQNCIDKSDENSEHCLCKDASFNCNRNINITESCVSRDFVCDGMRDCENGMDEAMCRRIKGTLHDPPGTGEVLRRSFGVWHSECFPNPVTTPKDILEICQSMGYEFGRKLEFENGKHPYGPAVSVEIDKFYMIRFSKTFISARGNRPLVTLVTAAEPCHRAFVQCT